MVNIETIRSALNTKGYFFATEALQSHENLLHDQIEKLSKSLGTPRRGRHGKLIEELTPKSEREAPTNSLSKKFGIGRFPFHIDSAHHLTPSRYLVFGCMEAKGEVASTLLIHAKNIELDRVQRDALKTGIFLVKNGRNSFYASIEPRNSKFIRWDPGCMFPKDNHARIAADAISRWPNPKSSKTINWSRGSLLVIDNWTMLHARGVVSDHHGHRSLLRATIA
ncbi:hypothetical protein ROLI_010740 [Roseobacter fucihabitans]|uniref:TauD/TfdA-like domain-containing protein n=1 Tax=Roseobacter fucihabitans TaxID=1537242 RepID=A0ABZ2BRY9_9RHOB|nr:TauD/TfdA family dioxygenase [Roseobacter litoralis]MBC6965534.1 Taurine catabolism dioxygenase TauD, TfdA family [Roseobacter litoralis]